MLGSRVLMKGTTNEGIFVKCAFRDELKVIAEVIGFNYFEDT